MGGNLLVSKGGQTNEKEKIHNIAKKIKDVKNGFYLGRGIDEKVAREGSLKMKEINYIHTEALPAGELKHGPIALIENDVTVIGIITDEKLIEKYHRIKYTTYEYATRE